MQRERRKCWEAIVKDSPIVEPMLASIGSPAYTLWNVERSQWKEQNTR